MTHADKRMNPIHRGSDAASGLIRKSRISIQDHILALAEFVLSECSCNVTVVLACDVTSGLYEVGLPGICAMYWVKR